jgi:hypothetical protein
MVTAEIELISNGVGMSEFSTLARRMWHQIEPVHAALYFAPEPFDEARALGYDVESRWPSYFARRAAPLGAVFESGLLPAQSTLGIGTVNAPA